MLLHLSASCCKLNCNGEVLVLILLAVDDDHEDLSVAPVLVLLDGVFPGIASFLVSTGEHKPGLDDLESKIQGR
jgi:hypothetical protein